MHAPAASRPEPLDRRALWTMLGVAAAAALYLLLCHHAVDTGSAWAPWLMLAPLSASLVGAAAYRWGRAAGGLTALALIVTLAVLQPWMLAHGAWLYMAEHVSFNLALAALFGFSLGDARGPLITRLARQVRGDPLPHDVAVYTRRVTQMWAMAFIAIAAMSIGLFLAAPLAWWSAFANLLTMPLVVVLFIGEYAVRRVVLRGIDHSRLIDGLRAFQAHQRTDGEIDR